MEFVVNKGKLYHLFYVY